MDINRVINIVLAELTLENLKYQERLEVLINSNQDIDVKVSELKSTLNSLSINELMITKFQALVSKTNNNNLINEQDGKI